MNQDYRTILQLSANEAADFFLRQDSYVNWDLPIYFKFEKLLREIYKSLDFSKMSYIGGAKDIDDVNYRIDANKDGQYSWRTLQLIHPLLYTHLVRLLTYKDVLWKNILDKFSEFQSNKHIECCSIPIVTSVDQSKEYAILNWWERVEQRSLELALDYSCCVYTDISNCYPSIYTHSIAWVLHTREYIKTLTSREADKTFGGSIDVAIRRMQNGQTNGIPQGSVLMDFIAEMVLGYADSLLSKAIEDNNASYENEEGQVLEEAKPLLITDYHVLRYRDDYRIFANNEATATLITKLLSEVLQVLNMRLNTQKTRVSRDLITDSIKTDKLYWNRVKHQSTSLQRTLLLIRDMSILCPNSGSVEVALHDFYEKLTPLDTLREESTSTTVFVSILVDIAAHNPRTYKMVSAILSKILELETDEKLIQALFLKIETRFKKMPYVGLLQLWLQRLTIKRNFSRSYNELLCQVLYSPSVRIWNNSWITDQTMLDVINNNPIVDADVLNKLSNTMTSEETSLGRGY